MAPADSRSPTLATSDPVPTLQSLHRQGLIAARYPEVRRLLQGLSARELLGAGQLLSRTPANEVLREHPATPTVSVAVTGHSNTAGLVAPLTAELARHGLLLRLYEGDFGSFRFDLADPGSELYAADTDLTVLLLDPTVVFDEVPTPWEPADVERVLAEKLRLLASLATAFAAASRGTLVINTIPLPRSCTAQLVDVRSRARLGAIWREANARLLRLMDEHPALVVLDTDPRAGDGLPLREARLAVYAKVQLSPEFTAGFARDVAHLARGLSGRAKKCLVLDLDNTVWGGVLGDDGIEGIEVAGTYRGEAFRALQKTAKQLAAQGVLLAAVSKNDIEPVREALGKHPEMTLREEDFVRVVANWHPKHDNLQQLAADLNLGTDSFVFADDSAYECGLVSRELPEVAVLQLTDEPALHTELLLADGWFDVRDITADDLRRPERYREEFERKDFLHSFSSLDDYLTELQVAVELTAVQPSELSRISQLTLRTNQFNLTTERLQPSEVQALADDPEGLVLAIRSRDRFGDNGLVGAVLARHEGATLHIDNFLLSCRVFSRGIEQACLSAVLRYARAHGSEQVLAGYRPTAKNGKVRDFYPRNGFEPHGSRGAGAAFRHGLARIADTPEHLRLTERIERNSREDRQ